MTVSFIVWIVFMQTQRFCGAVIPSKDTTMLEFNQYWKSDEAPSMIYSGLESLIKKVDGCKNNPEILTTTKLYGHIHCEYSVSTI